LNGNREEDDVKECLARQVWINVEEENLMKTPGIEDWKAE
jgi:hypothetical protein